MAEHGAIDDVFAELRQALEGKRNEAHERIRLLRAALDTYVNAREAEMAAEFAAKNGLEWKRASASSTGAALTLRSLVESLPELRGQSFTPITPVMPIASAEPAPSPRQQTDPAPAPAPSVPAPVLTTITTATTTITFVDADAEAVELVRAMKSLDLDKLPEPLFRAWAEELAAKARMLQERVPKEEIAAHIIRQVSAVALSRHVQGIYGLNRKHAGDWKELAADAEKERRKIQGEPPPPPVRKTITRGSSALEPK